jgi:hypothetical protein
MVSSLHWVLTSVCSMAMFMYPSRQASIPAWEGSKRTTQDETRVCSNTRHGLVEYTMQISHLVANLYNSRQS